MPRAQRSEVEGINTTLCVPCNFIALRVYALSERPVFSLDVWDCANVIWSDLDKGLLGSIVAGRACLR